MVILPCFSAEEKLKGFLFHPAQVTTNKFGDLKRDLKRLINIVHFYNVYSLACWDAVPLQFYMF